MFHLKLLLFTLLLPLLRVNCWLAGRKCYVDYSVGTCTLLWECPHLVTEIMIAGNPMPLYMENKLKQLICPYYGEHPLVCCAPPIDIFTTTLRTPDGQNSNTKFNKTESKVQNARIADIQNHPNLGLLPTNCGSSNAERIIGGSVTELFEMPWMVLLSYQSVRGTELNCDGTLINEWYVLTAAHCVAYLPYGLELKHVILGEYDVYQNPDCTVDYYGKEICAPPIKTAAVAEVIVHSGYKNKDSFTDDIALIRLSEPADFNLESMKPICLPVTSQLQTENLIGVNSIVAGWGKTEKGQKSPQLLSVTLPIMSKEDCQVPYKGNAIIHDQQLCAGGIKNKDSCGGDSGGPLMYPGNLGPGPVKHVQRGIVSFGNEECGKAGVPGVYTNVAYYMDWILDHIHG